MRKNFFILIASVGIFCNSCSNNSGPSATAIKNLDAMHGIQQCFDSKDFSKLGDYVAADALDHAGDAGDIKGIDNMRTEFEKMSANNENAKTEIIKELADEEYVMSWLHFTGALKTAQMGYKAGEKYDMRAIELAKFKDGKMVEHWTFMEPAEMMKMIGNMQSSAPTSIPPDTTGRKQ